jgi:hypothetical protein
MKNWGILSAVALLATASAAHAAVLNTDFYDFEGRAFIENDPVSTTCANAGFVFGNVYTVVYRYNTGTNVVSDAIAFISERSDFRINATQTPFSLRGTDVPAQWDYIDSRAGLSTGVTAAATTIITPTTITSATKTVVLVGSISNFFGVTGCTLGFHAALERRPD